MTGRLFIAAIAIAWATTAVVGAELARPAITDPRPTTNDDYRLPSFPR
jgi:hypothetical protein